MMRNKILIFLFSPFFFTALFSQEKVYTDIQKNDKIYPGKVYTFDKVIDARANKEYIGVVYKSDLGNEYHADLNEPVASAIMRFLVTTFPKSSSEIKINIIVNTFEIGHILTGRKKDTGYVKVNLDFYKQSGDSSFLIYNYTNRLVDVNDNIALTHSNRMKRIILMAVGKVDSVVLYGAKYYVTKPPEKSGQVATIKQPNVNKDAEKDLRSVAINSEVAIANQKDEDLNYPRDRIIMIGGHAAFCPGSSMYGGNINFLRRIKKMPRTLVGININYSKIIFPDDLVLPRNTSYKLRTTDFGFRLLRQLKNVVFFNFNPHLLIGRETYTAYYPGSVTVTNAGTTTSFSNNTETEHTFLGWEIDSGIYLLYPKKTGAYMGVDFVMRFTNSDIFETDFGIKFNIGVAF